MARKGEGRMSETDFRSVVQGAITDCANFTDTQLSLERALATNYYLGKPFGNEEEGRSQVVLTEVRDCVDGMLPSLMRIAHPPGEHSVEFIPTREDNVEQAAQKTDYVRYVFEQDCSGKLQSLAVQKDGLVRKIGIFSWGWDESAETKSYKQEGIDQQQLEALASDDSIKLGSVVKARPTKQMLADQAQAMQQYEQQMQQQPPQQDQPAPPPPELPQYYEVEFTQTDLDGKPWVEAVPPEEFIFNRQARSLSRALVVGRRTEKTRGELLAMGISEKDIDEHSSGGSDSNLHGNAEELARRDVAGVGRSAGFGYSQDPELGKANGKILYADVNMNIDYDGDGKAELRRICTIGPTYYPVKNDPADEKRFSIFTPYPEPHTLLGGSVADRTMDMQKINSSVLRAILDGGAAAAFPRAVYLEGQASVADIMNNAIGAPIRERTLNAVRYLETPFTAEKLLPLLDRMQDIIERRTGRNKGAAGLDADALQSTGKEAVGAVLSGNQEQLELLSVIYAEMALKPLFEGLGRLLQQKQPRARMLKLRGKWTPVDPRSWDANMDVQVNVNLGSASTDKKVAILMAVAADQENFIQQGGLGNPAVPLPKLLSSRKKIMELQGIKDFGNYYNELPPDWQPPPPPPAPPDPSVAAMQAESEMSHVKAMKELAIKQDELTLKAHEFELKKEELALKAQIETNKSQALSFDQAFQVEQLAVTTETARLQIQATIDAQAADREMAASQDTNVNELKFRLEELKAANTPKPPAPQPINVAAPDMSAMPAPVIHVHPAEAPVVNVTHTPPPDTVKKPSKRKGKIKKEPDGSFSFESDS